MLVWLIFFTYNAIRNPLVGNWGGLISLHGDFFFEMSPGYQQNASIVVMTLSLNNLGFGDK